MSPCRPHLLGLAALSAAHLLAADALPAQYLEGIVLEWGSEQPIEGASVSLVAHEGGHSVSDLTGRGGRFYVRAPLEGSYTLVIDALGYTESAAGPVELTAGQTVQVRYFLTAEPIEIEPLEVLVERRSTALDQVGFYDRLADGLGTFLTREDVLRERPPETADLLRGIPGIRLERNARGEPLIVMRGGRQRRCYPHVFLDGVREVGGGSTPVNVSMVVRPDDIQGVEVYSGSAGIPSQFSGLYGSCGVIVLWTR